MISLRPLKPTDMSRIYKWRNIPAIYEAGFTPRPVDIETHKAWFNRLISDPTAKGFVICRKLTPIGFLKIAPWYEAAEITTYVDPKFGGKGYGSKAIRLGAEVAKGMGTPVVARIIKGNAASKRAFQKAKFSFLMSSGVTEVYIYDR